MNTKQGFTLIEMLIFIVIMGILGVSILIAFNDVFRGISRVTNQTATTAYAVRCLEWFVGQRTIKGFDNVICSNSVPTFCSANLPSKYTISTNVDYTTVSGDSTNYKMVTVVVNSDISHANLPMIISNY